MLFYGYGTFTNFEVAAALLNISTCQNALSFFSQNLQVMLRNHLLVQQHDLQDVVETQITMDQWTLLFRGLKVPVPLDQNVGEYKPRWPSTPPIGGTFL